MGYSIKFQGPFFAKGRIARRAIDFQNGKCYSGSVGAVRNGPIFCWAMAPRPPLRRGLDFA